MRLCWCVCVCVLKAKQSQPTTKRDKHPQLDNEIRNKKIIKIYIPFFFLLYNSFSYCVFQPPSSSLQASLLFGQNMRRVVGYGKPNNKSYIFNGLLHTDKHLLVCARLFLFLCNNIACCCCKHVCVCKTAVPLQKCPIAKNVT